MANFFDQFDTPATPPAGKAPPNFFDQFDQPEAQPTQAAAPAPKANAFDKFDEPGLGTYVKEFAKSIPEGFRETIASSLKGEAAAPTIAQLPGESDLEYNLRREDEIAKLAQRPVKQEPLYKAGEAVSSIGADTLKAAPGFEDSLTRGVGGGLGSVLASAASGLINPGLAMRMAVTGGQGEQADRAIKAGASEEQIRRASYLAGVAGATDMVDAMLPMLGSAGKVAGLIKRIGVSSLKSAFIEGGQEGLQQFIQNLITKGVYKPDQEIWEDVDRSALIGFLTGGIAGPLTGGARKEGGEVPQTPEEKARAVQESLAVMRGGNPEPDPPFMPPPAAPPAAPVAVPLVEEPSTEGRGGVRTQTAPQVAPEAPLALPAPAPTPEAPPLLALPPPAPSVTEQALETPEEKSGIWMWEDEPAVSPNPVDPWAHLRLPERMQAVREEAERIKEAFRQRREQLLKAKDHPTSVELPLGQEPNDQAPQIASASQPGALIQSDYNPTTTVVPTRELIAGRQLPYPWNLARGFGADQMTGATGQVEAMPESALPPEAYTRQPSGVYSTQPLGASQLSVNFSGMQPPAHVVYLQDRDTGARTAATSYHEAPLDAWLDSIRPAGVNDDINALMHHSVVNRLKQVVPPNVMVHVVARDELRDIRGRNADATQIRGGEENILAPTIMLGDHLVAGDPRQLSHVVLHEAVHAATADLLSRDDAIGINARTDVRMVMSSAMSQWIPEMNYENAARAFDNEREFVAEALSNPNLQQVLAAMNTPKWLRQALKLKGRPNLWQGFVQQLHNILGMPVNAESYTLLEAISRISENIIDKQHRMVSADAMRPPVYLLGAKQNRAIMDQESKDIPTPAITPLTAGPRKAADAIFGGRGNVPYGVQQAAVHADRMNVGYAFAATLHQVTRSNPNFTPQVTYTELVDAMDRLEKELQDVGVRLLKDWYWLGEEGRRLAGFIDEMAHMSYRSAVEVTNGIVRHPSPQELQAMLAKHNIGTKGQAFFNRINTLIVGDARTGTKGFIDLIGDAIEKHMIKQAGVSVASQATLPGRIAGMRQQIADLKKRPYFPFTNFGRHYVLVKDPTGRLLHYETVERRGLRSARREQERRLRELSVQWQKDFGRKPIHQTDIITDTLPEHTGPLLNIPSVLLQHVSNVALMTPEMITTAQYLQQAQLVGVATTLSPRYQRKYYVPGYGVDYKGHSLDLKRSFARFMFHGSKFYAKAVYLDDLRDLVQLAKRTPGGGTGKEGQIAAFMNDHFNNNVLDARGDWGWAKGAIFTFAMGYVPAAATQNLAQTPMVTLPFLAAKFGELRASKAIVKATLDFKNTYRKYGTYKNSTAFEYQAISYGIETGRIQETQAAEIAAMTQMNLLEGLAGNAAQRGWQYFMKASSIMFELAERANRRIAFRAALDLAMKNPNAKYIDQAVRFKRKEYLDLRNRGFSDAQARSIITAIDAVDQTQFIYSRTNRPKMFRGPASIVFVFKTYVQSLTFMLGQNPDVMWRFCAIMLLIGGIRGLPFAEDILSLAKMLGRWFGGPDFNVEVQARKFLIDLFGRNKDDTPKVDPDLIMQGTSRVGYGIPALADMIGSFATGKPGRGLMSGGAPIWDINPETGEQRKRGFGVNVPLAVLDRSRAITSGMILPIDVGKAFTPTEDLNRTQAEVLQKASGAFFSVGFNMYKAAMDHDLPLSDWKRWERAVPRVLGDLSESYRAFTEGRERVKGGVAGGSTVIPYDIRDTEQMMEALAIAMGYQTLRKQARWDYLTARLETESYFKMQRNGLLENLYEAVAGGVDEEKEKVKAAIKKYNTELPQELKGFSISDEQAQRSVEGRLRARELREMGLPSQKGAVPAARELQRYFPQSTIDVRRIGRPQPGAQPQ